MEKRKCCVCVSDDSPSCLVSVHVSSLKRLHVGPTIDKLLSIPTNLDGLTPLQASDCFLKSEEFYVERALRVACEMETRLRWHIKLKKTVLLEHEISPLFLNLQQIYSFNRKFYNELLKLRLHGNLVQSIGTCVLQHCPFFRLYKDYIRDYRKGQVLCDTLLTKRKKFHEWLDLNELCYGYSLKTLLLAPVTRLPQYLSFLGAIVRSVESTSVSAVKIHEAITALSQVSDDISYALKDEVARKLVVTIQSQLFGNSCNLISPHRYVVKHSDLKKMFEHGKMMGSGELKHVLPLVDMRVEEVEDDERLKVKNGFRIHTPMKSFICCASNRNIRQAWIDALRQQIQIVNTSASTLQKSQLETTSSEEFERRIKHRPTSTKHIEDAKHATRSASASASSSSTSMTGVNGGGVATMSSVSSFSSARRRHGDSTDSSSNLSRTHSHQTIESSTSHNASPPAAPPGGPPPIPIGYGTNRHGYGDDSIELSDNTDPSSTSSGPSEVLTESLVSSGPTLEYDLPSSSSNTPPVPPLTHLQTAINRTGTAHTPHASTTQTQERKTIEAEWIQVFDPSSRSYYYYHRHTGETTWNEPNSFQPASSTSSKHALSSPISATGSNSRDGGGAVEEKLKETLDRYRQFVQEEEDQVRECGEEEWD